MMEFNPVLYAMMRKQEIMDEESKPRDIPKSAACLVIESEDTEGFIEMNVIPPEGEEYDGDNYDSLSPQYKTVLHAYGLISKLFSSADDPNIDVEYYDQLDDDLDDPEPFI